jgi:hypothetical protein
MQAWTRPSWRVMPLERKCTLMMLGSQEQLVVSCASTTLTDTTCSVLLPMKVVVLRQQLLS